MSWTEVHPQVEADRLFLTTPRSAGFLPVQKGLGKGHSVSSDLGDELDLPQLRPSTPISIRLLSKFHMALAHAVLVEAQLTADAQGRAERVPCRRTH